MRHSILRTGSGKQLTSSFLFFLQFLGLCSMQRGDNRYRHLRENGDSEVRNKQRCESAVQTACQTSLQKRTGGYLSEQNSVVFPAAWPAGQGGVVETGCAVGWKRERGICGVQQAGTLSWQQPAPQKVFFGFPLSHSLKHTLLNTDQT